jgi:putative peptidoglycan lipid II flippase
MSFARSLFTVSSLTVLSRIAGFVRDALTALYLGASYQADAFFVAQRLPNLFRTLFAEGAFSAAFVPLYTEQKEISDDEKAQRFAGEALGILIAMLLPFTGLLVWGMPYVIHIMAPGFTDEPEKFDMAVRLSRITFPYLLLISITALQTGVLNARDIFGPGAAAPIMLNIVLIIALLVSDFISTDIGNLLAWAMIVAGSLQALWLAISCYRARCVIPLLRPKLNEMTVRLFKNIGPGAVGAGAAQIYLLLTTVLASTLPTGAVSYLYYADRLNQLPLGIVGIAVATTLLPLLSKYETAHDKKMLTYYSSRAIEFCLLLGLPATLGLGIAASPIIQTLFEHGVFTHDDSIATAQTLAAYSLGIPAFLLVKVFASRFFAQQDTRTPVKIAIIALCVNVGGALLMLHSLEHIGMALAMSLATWTNAVLLYLQLRKRGAILFDERSKKRIPKILLAAVIMGGLTFILTQSTNALFIDSSLSNKLIGMAEIIGPSSVAYTVLLSVFGTFRISELRQYMGKK